MALTSRARAQSVSAVFDRVSDSVVMVLAYDAAGTVVSQGSGCFLTGDGYVLTNAHVVSGAYSLKVISSAGDFTLVRLMNADDGVDLALLRVPARASCPVVLAEGQDLRIGQRVIAIGNPFGLQRSVSDGIISGIRRLSDGVELIQTTAPISPGSSGGVLLDERGCVVGITTGRLRLDENIAFAVSVATIRRYLESCRAMDGRALPAVQLRPAGEVAEPPVSVALRRILGFIVFFPIYVFRFFLRVLAWLAGSFR